MHHRVKTTSGKVISPEFVLEILEQETSAAKKESKKANQFDMAAKVLATTIQGKEYADFLTTLCYDYIVTKQSKL